MFTIVRKKEAIIKKITDNKKAYNLITKNVNPYISLALIEAEDFDGDVTAEYNRIYYVLEGNMLLRYNYIDHILHPGDSCFISKDEQYRMKGSFRAIIVNQPAFGA